MRLKEKTLRLHELLVAPSKEGIDVVGRVHLVELPQHLRLVAPLEGHHRSLQFVRVSDKELHVAVLPLHVPEGPLLGGGHPHRL